MAVDFSCDTPPDSRGSNYPEPSRVAPGQIPFDQFGGDDGQLDWSPDGKWLVACASGASAGDSYLALVSRATGEVIPLPFTKLYHPCGATWRPT